MPKFEVSELKIPDIVNPFVGKKYERFKRTLVTLMLGQRTETFESESSAEGPWKPLSVQQAKNRFSIVPRRNRYNVGAVKILQSNGTLRSSFSDSPGQGKGQLVEEIGQDDVAIATNVEYARVHNEGGEIHIPEQTRTVYFKSARGGRTLFASAHDKCVQELSRRAAFGMRVTIPAHTVTMPRRSFDQFTDQNREEINIVTDKFLNGD